MDEYLRLVELHDGAWELQSATCVFRQRGSDPGDVLEVTLAATVHVGDREYYAGLQDECETNYDVVLFELITGEENLTPGRPPSLSKRRRRGEDCGVMPWASEEFLPGVFSEEENDESLRNDESFSNDSSSSTEETFQKKQKSFLPRLANKLSPTDDARNLASVHGLVPQLDALDLTGANWYVADIPKQQLLKLQVEAGETALGSRRALQTPTSEIPGIGAKIVSLLDRLGVGLNGGAEKATGPLPPVVEAFVIAARGRAGGGPVKQLIRYLCWCVPCPEAHLLLLDWVWGGGRPAPVLGAMLDSLASGQIESVRRLAFAQMIVSAQAKGAVGGGSEVPILVTKRNEKAIECLRLATQAPGATRVALLYGALHMPGLSAALLDVTGCGTGSGTSSPDSGTDRTPRTSEDGFKMELSQIRWRSVWRVEPPRSNKLVRLAAIPVLLFLDGTDWAATITDAAAAFSETFYFSSAALLLMYVIRHGAIYYSLGKWVLEWNKQLFDARVGDADSADGRDGLRGT